ncbi:MAG: DNA polymerase III subunit delta [Roseburia sp.]
MKSINEDIKNGQIKTVYLLYGEEAYLKRQYRDKLKKALIPEGDTMNYTAFEGKSVEVKQVIDLAETLPFFNDHRMILVEGTGFFKNSNEELAEYLGQIPESTCIVFVEEEVDKRSKTFKAAAKAGRAVEFVTPDEKTLMRWIMGRVQKENKKVSQSVLAYFISVTGSDMENMDHELEKLFCYTLNRPEITMQDLEEICVGQTENKIFDMITAIALGNQKQALNLYYDLLTLKEAPMRILYLIAKQFQSLLLVKSMAAKGYPAATIAKTDGTPSFVVQKKMGQAKRFTMDELKQAIESCAQAEEDVKQGRLNDQIAVELLIVQYSRKK